MGPPQSSPEIPELLAGDKAGAGYWDKLWGNESLLAAVDPYGRGAKNFPARRFHQYLQEAFKGLPAQGRKLLEVGCAQSALLPYFSKHFGFEVFGIDHSEIGGEKARKVLQREGVIGQIYCADLFSPPGELLGQFDAVLSMGVIEHFEKTAECVAAMARFLKPAGGSSPSSRTWPECWAACRRLSTCPFMTSTCRSTFSVLPARTEKPGRK